MTAAIQVKIKETAFREWTTQALMREFKLKKIKSCSNLTQWLNTPYTIRDKDKEVLKEMREAAAEEALFWNEDELKLNLIYPLIRLAHFKTSTYNVFAERMISASFDNQIKLLGKPDLMVASGSFEPVHPYFFFHEYKKEKGSSDDPLGQLLCAMMVGQKLNNNNKPVYGAYVIGRNWFFVTLEDKNYCVSNNFSASQEDELNTIFQTLKTIKTIIETELME